MGVLKGFDALLNLVLDDCMEVALNPTTGVEEQRPLGLLIVRGPNVSSICPEDGLVEIENPFQAGDGEEA